MCNAFLSSMYISEYLMSPVLFCFVLLLVFTKVDGHGHVLNPQSRNKAMAEAGLFTCPHCLQSKGNEVIQRVREKGYTEFPDVVGVEGTHGLCGDPSQNANTDGLPPISQQRFMEQGPATAVYVEGSEIEITIGMAANHKGIFEFRICDIGLDTTTLSQIDGQNCLDKHLLTRVDPATRNECQGVQVGNSADTVDCQPLDADYPHRWYLPPNSLAGQSLDAWTGGSYKMKFHLPLGLTCDHCTMQWWWLTANSCTPRGFREYYRSFKTKHPELSSAWDFSNNGPGDCSVNSPTEQFWNCVDMIITPKAGSTTPPISTTTENPTTTATTAASEPPSTTATTAASEPPTTTATTAASEPPTTTGNPTSSSEETCPGEWGNCHLSMCCNSGYVCYEQNEWYAQCRTINTCPAGWSCKVLGGDVTATPHPEESCPHEHWSNCTQERCCKYPYSCFEQNQWYAQCLLPHECNSGNGWTCSILDD